MKKIIIFPILGALIFSGCSLKLYSDKKVNEMLEAERQRSQLAVDFLNNKVKDLENEVNNWKTEDLLRKGDSSLEEYNDEYNLYTNYKLGFALKVPKAAYNYNIKNGQMEWEKLTIVEKDQAVYLMPQSERESFLKNFKSEREALKEGITFGFYVQDAKNEKELDDFMKYNFGKDCNLGKKNSSWQDGAYVLSIDSLYDPDSGKDCFVNYAAKTMYYPKKNKLVSWDMGQAINFSFDKNNYRPADDTISESLWFLDERDIFTKHREGEALRKLLADKEDLNSDKANESFEYFDEYHGLSISLPYNKSWGSKRYALYPVDEFDGQLHFGRLVLFEGNSLKREYSLEFRALKNLDSVLAGLNKDFKAEKKKIGNFSVLEYIEKGVCDVAVVELSGQKYNYRFTSVCSYNADEALKVLEGVVSSLELIN